jgi:four helix bundle protein
MAFKFEKLEVWQLALEYIDGIYGIAEQLPPSEMYNLKSQIIRAATSTALNIAEGSQGQTDMEQARFLGLAIRSAIETVACLHIIRRRAYLADPTPLRQAYQNAQTLVRKLQAMRRAVTPEQQWIREDPSSYLTDEADGFQDA